VLAQDLDEFGDRVFCQKFDQDFGGGGLTHWGEAQDPVELAQFALQRMPRWGTSAGAAPTQQRGGFAGRESGQTFTEHFCPG